MQGLPLSSDVFALWGWMFCLTSLFHLCGQGHLLALSSHRVYDVVSRCNGVTNSLPSSEDSLQLEMGKHAQAYTLNSSETELSSAS